MHYYLLLFVIILTFSMLEIVNVPYRYQQFFSWIVIGLFIFTAGFKYETGVDWYAYTNLFDDTPPINEIGDPLHRSEIFSTIDYGFALFLSLVKFLGGSIQVVFFLISFVSSILIYNSLKLYSVYKLTSLLIYFSLLFFILDMSGIRQGFALSVFLYAIKYIHEGKLLKYVLIMLVGASFHWSAYLLIPMYFLLNRNFSSYSLVIFFTCSLFIYIFNIHWLDALITKFFPSIENAILAARLLAYTTSTYSAARAFDRGTIVSILFYIVTFSIGLYYRKQLQNRIKYFNIFFNLYICQIFTFFCMFEFVEMADRLRLYFLLSNIIILPAYVYLFSKRWDRIVCWGYIFVFTFISCQAWILSSPMTIAYSPYQNYLIYKIFNIESTGYKRLQKQAQDHE